MTDTRRRIVVAGTAFGRIYLTAVRSADQEYELAGVLSRGSAYSRACASRHQVPMFTSIAELPDDIDILCVAVGSSVLGGPGAVLAQEALEKGIHVLEEHPVHKSEILDCLRTAKRHNAAYAVNTLYPNIRAVRQFLSVAAFIRNHQPVRFIDAACNSQVLYPLVDIVGRAAGNLRPWAFETLTPNGTEGPFTTVVGSIADVPISLRVQNQVHPEDPDNHSYLFHRLTLGFDAGILTLADTHGPVLWNPRLHSPRDETARLVMSGPGTDRLDVPSTLTLGDCDTRTYLDVFAHTWPDAVQVALRELCRDIEAPRRRSARGQWAFDISAAWRDITERIGMPRVIRPPIPEPLAIHDLVAAANVEDTRNADTSTKRGSKRGQHM